MAEGLIEQVRELLNQKDQQSLKYVLSDEDPSVIQDICSLLQEKDADKVRKLYKQSRPDGELNFTFPTQDKEDKNQKIDQYLLEKRQESEKKQESFLEMLAKINQKLIYEEHFGYPFYDLFKRILSTHGDLHPLVQTVKALHSQVQILYSTLFSGEVLNVIQQRYHNYEKGFKYFLEKNFSQEIELYQNFQSVYKNIKKSTEDEQSCSQEEEQVKQIPLSQDLTLKLDEQEFLVKLAEGISIEQFNQFTKNRSYNFLCFGVKKYMLFLSISMDILNTLKQKQFADLMSFLSIRFIRKILFNIIRQRGEGKLINLKTPITPHQIKVIGNQLIDQIAGKIQKLIEPVKNVQEEAKEIFFNEFQTMAYSEFIPGIFITQAQQNKMNPAQYTWKKSKDYRKLWVQRVKAERYIEQNKKGPKPMPEYVNFVLENLQQYKANNQTLWKKYIMKKFDSEAQTKITPSKRVKLQSLND